MNCAFWRGRRVLVTGHSGFKGSWLTEWLKVLGAEVTGYSIEPPTEPSLFEEANVREGIESASGDIRDLDRLRRTFAAREPEVVFHLAAQSLVRAGYDDPVGTYSTNVIGTVNVLEVIRHMPSVRAAIIVTSDKCYDNGEQVWPYRENDRLGGRDPYASSKACAELVTEAYRFAFFEDSRCGIATVRAGNVIGGGDWAANRLVPDLLRAFGEGAPALIRNPGSIRPWQFVLEPLRGYLQLAEALVHGDGGLAGSWNFGPHDHDIRPVHWISDRLVELWGGEAAWRKDEQPDTKPEAFTLKLDSSKSRTLLGWDPKVDLATALEWIVEWHRNWLERRDSAASLLREQIERFESIHQ
ncbi:MAG: CDP-glucose 4,6-dehydratase [Acidobacteria bacterium]|nr:CDP-glucose 4,6-dehydratase [Acidobacteriota bacterium]